MNWPIKIQGRFLSKADVDEIRMLLCEHASWNRSRLSRELCVRWSWKRSDGQIKDMACRELLRKLESRSLIKLPPRQRPGPGKPPKIEVIEIDQRPISCILSDIQPVQVVNARKTVEYEKTFNHLVKTYHYLGYGRPVGQNMKYLIFDRDKRILGCLLFGAAAWKIEAREQWLGWSSEVREQNIGLLCNNTRFLILDWVTVPHLASHVLGTCLRRLSSDWRLRYGSDIVMVETFVDQTRYRGTCYKAANWCKIGQTKGRGRQDRLRTSSVPIKDIFVYPLRRDYRELLLA